MAWKSLFKKQPTPTPEPETPLQTPSRDIPPHLAQAIERRSGPSAPSRERTPEQRRRDALHRQRTAILFDIEQGESALSPDNPWNQRIDLLGDALGTVDQDLNRVETVVPGPFAPLPATPIAIGEIVEQDDTVTVHFTVESEAFIYAEEPDWADRSRIITRGDLHRVQGDVAALVPASVPPELRDALVEHLASSALSFATELRDRMLDGESLPEHPTLSDLAGACPVCGGWTDWRKTCQACAHRSAEITALKREQSRLLDERNREADERHRLIEGMPLARRRLKDVERDIARLEAS